MIQPPECSRPVHLDTLGNRPQQFEVIASEEERLALAKRFELQAINTLSATVSVSREGDTITLMGQLNADVVQSCIASGDPVPEQVKDRLNLRIVPEHSMQASEEEVELSGDDCDTMVHDGKNVDIGEAIAQSLYLALNPYPRSAKADAVLKAAGVIGEEDAGPFGALAGLKQKLEGNKPSGGG